MSSKDIALSMRGLSKSYTIRHNAEKSATLREAARGWLRGTRLSASRETFWALQDVSLDIEQGDVVGIIGRNGAGKSTLLKILSRITEPTRGEVHLHGRVGSLLEVGTGFHPELTGRENIFLNGAILGMTRREIARQFDAIVDFAGVEKFLDTPVKRYSSGMYVRLAFAVAAHLEPEILIVDEVLAVGDAAFQKKCLGKMQDVAKAGRTILFVSHQMAAVSNLCTRAVLLDKGRVIEVGSVQRVTNHYLAHTLPSAVEGVPLRERTDRSGNGAIRLTGFHIEDANGCRLATVSSGMDVVFVLVYEGKPGVPLRMVDVGLSINSPTDQALFVHYRSYSQSAFRTAAPSGFFRYHIPRLPLSPGRYRVGARVTVGGDEADWPRDGVGYLDVESGDFYGMGSKGFEGATPFLVDGQWEATQDCVLA